jgi:hypothetical protein
MRDLVTRWEDWRKLIGPQGSRHRRLVLDQLETQPALLYWGDSWFSTPLYPNLARQSAARIAGIGMLIGRPGATAEQLFSASDVRKVAERLRHNPFDVLCLSAGGNDALSQRLARVFAAWIGTPKAKIDAAQAYAELVDRKFFEQLLARYRSVLDALQPVRQARPAFRVVGHAYAPLLKIGVPGDLSVPNIGLIALIKDDVGPWLWGPMQHVLPDKAEGKRFADRLLLDGFRDSVMRQLAQAYPQLFSYADFSTVPAMRQAASWYDEIHPTGEGFAALASVFNDTIRMALPAAKRAAVG